MILPLFDQTQITWDSTLYTFDELFLTFAAILTTLQIPTADSATITADTVNFTADGADLINGGASDISKKKDKRPSVTVSQPLFVPIYGTSLGGNTPLPVIYPPQTYTINGAQRRSGQ
jgi:hypothetical protein